MQLHELKRKTENKKPKRVGRGGGRGKTSGRGTKGQKARAGHSIMPAIREQLKKLPKLRGRGVGGLISIQNKPHVVNLASIEKAFSSGATVNSKTLIEMGLVRTRKGVKNPVIKVLGDGDISKKFIFSGVSVSGSAKEKIEKAGGSVATLEEKVSKARSPREKVAKAKAE
ncbi:MAG TPA: uL15 family ribosomal protein [Candidatus Paceibacterota bacterium]|nr:uL15 family ribosomal protein [Candidatus Paceibacterota bacterium]